MSSCFQVVNRARGTVLATRLEVAGSAAERTKGLLGRDGLAPGEGLWIVPCESVHTFFMRFAIDVLFLDASGCLIRAVRDLKPWRVCWPVWRARVVVEIPAGTVALRNIQTGIRYQLVGK